MAENKNAPKAPDVAEIDLGNIKNLKAVEKTDPTYKQIVENNANKGFNRSTSKFNFADPELIPLPSGGILYQNVTDDKDVLKGFIRMYPMSLKEEEILSTPRFLKTGSATRMLMERCCASAIDAKDLLLFDSNFIMFYLRKISYGDEYKFEIKCGNSVCEKKFEHTVNISELQFEELPETVEEPIVINLPKSGYTVECMLPRLYHSEEIYMKNQNRKKKSSDEDKRMIDNLLVTTIRILDRNKKEVSKKDWEEFFEAIPGMDAAELREKTKFSTGVDNIKGIGCPYCGAEYSGNIPIGPEFFRF